MATALPSTPFPSPSEDPGDPLPMPAVEPLADGLTRLLDDLHEELAGEQLRVLKRLRLQPSELQAVLDELHEGRARGIRRFVAGLDRGRRLRLAGALHLLSADLEGGAVVGS